jgi:hypothetical protein
MLALKIALAYCSGHYKQVIPTKSFLTNREGFNTIEMSVFEGKQLD